MPIRRHLNYWVQTWWNDEDGTWRAWVETPNGVNIFFQATAHKDIEELANLVVMRHLTGTLEATTGLPSMEGA